MSYTSYSKAATMHLIDKQAMELELIVRGIVCEYPGCVRQAWAVAESAVSMFMCVKHYELWAYNATTKRIMENVKLEDFKVEMMRTVAAAYENPDEFIAWDGKSPLAERVFDAAAKVIESHERRDAMPLMPAIEPVPEPEPILNGQASKLSTLENKNSYQPFTPFFI